MALLIFYVMTVAASSASLASRSMRPQRTPRSFCAVYRVRSVISPGRRRCGSRRSVLLIYAPWPPAAPRTRSQMYPELPNRHTSTDSSSRRRLLTATPTSLARYTLAWIPNRSPLRHGSPRSGYGVGDSLVWCACVYYGPPIVRRMYMRVRSL